MTTKEEQQTKKKYCVEVGEYGVRYFDTREERDFWCNGYCDCQRNHFFRYDLKEYEADFIDTD